MGQVIDFLEARDALLKKIDPAINTEVVLTLVISRVPLINVDAGLFGHGVFRLDTEEMGQMGSFLDECESRGWGRRYRWSSIHKSHKYLTPEERYLLQIAKVQIPEEEKVCR